MLELQTSDGKQKKVKWNLEFLEHNRFLGNVVAKVMMDGQVVGSFNIPEDDVESVKMWKELKLVQDDPQYYGPKNDPPRPD